MSFRFIFLAKYEYKLYSAFENDQIHIILSSFVLKSFEEQGLIGLCAKFQLCQSCASWFSPITTTFLTKIGRKDFPLGRWAVFHLSQTASYGSKFGPLLFALWGQEFHSKCSAIVKFAYLHIRIHYVDFSMRFHADMRISIRINRNRICAYEKQPHGQL